MSKFLKLGGCLGRSLQPCRVLAANSTLPKRSTPLLVRSMGSGSGGGAGSTGGSSGGGGGGDGGDGAQPSGPNGLWALYLKCLDAQPVLTKSLTSGVISGFGDVFAQLVIEKHELDLKRLFIFAFLGTALVGPVLHIWYLTLSRLVTATGSTGAALRMGLDQFGFAPVFVATFISSLMLLQGASQQHVEAKLRQDWWEAVRVNWLIWVPAQYINFRYVPQSLQVLGANVTALVWNTYLSINTHRDVQPPKP